MSSLLHNLEKGTGQRLTRSASCDRTDTLDSYHGTHSEVKLWRSLSPATLRSTPTVTSSHRRHKCNEGQSKVKQCC